MVAKTQSEHARINAREFPGTRQICVMCDKPTERCEEDEIFSEDRIGPLCLECYDDLLELVEDDWREDR